MQGRADDNTTTSHQLEITSEEERSVRYYLTYAAL